MLRKTANLRLRKFGKKYVLESFSYERWSLLASFDDKEHAIRAFEETALYMS